MKKLLTIIFFGLFLSGNSYAQTEVEIALENCADETFNNWEDESYKKTMGSRKGAIVRKWKKNEKGEEYLQQGWTLNRKVSEEQKTFEGEKTDAIFKRWENMREKGRYYLLRGYDYYGLIAHEIVKKTSIKKKAKSKVYADFLIACEKLYKETPYGFVLKWND